MKQNGLLQRIMFKELDSKFKNIIDPPFRTVDIFTVTPLYALYFLGMVFSVLTLIYEQYKWEAKEKKKKTICERIHGKYRHYLADPVSGFFYNLIPTKVKVFLEI